MFKQYRVYVNLIEGNHREKVLPNYEQALEHVEQVKKAENFTTEVKNVFITEEGYDLATGKMLLEKDVYCHRNETWYNTVEV